METASMRCPAGCTHLCALSRVHRRDFCARIQGAQPAAGSVCAPTGRRAALLCALRCIRILGGSPCSVFHGWAKSGEDRERLWVAFWSLKCVGLWYQPRSVVFFFSIKYNEITKFTYSNFFFKSHPIFDTISLIIIIIIKKIILS